MNRLAQWLPFLRWLPGYNRRDLAGDATAAVIVAIMLVPQSLAYAMLAGLPAEYGLYASIAPLAAYGLLGTSRTLSVGPVAVISLLTATALAPHAAAGSERYVQLALLLALMVGVLSLVLGLLRAGFVAGLLSHPVVAGFITGSSLVIILSQLPLLLGVKASGRLPWEVAASTAEALAATNPVTLGIGAASVLLLVLARSPLRALLAGLGQPQSAASLASRASPALVVLAGLASVWWFGLDQRSGVAVVGHFAAGLPGITLPAFDARAMLDLLPSALAIVLVGYVESIGVGRTLGAHRRETVEPNAELVALGAANLASGLTGGFPVTGGFSRSVVNFDAGARTGMSSLMTAGLIALVALFAAPMFSHLPQAVLAAAVIVAVAGLVRVGEFRRLWRYSRTEALLMLATTVAVLAAGVEIGVAAGVALSLAAILWRAARPHMAVLGRVGGTEHFRNVLRHKVQTVPGMLLVRIDESLFFANIAGVENRLLRVLRENPQAGDLVLVCSGVNGIDSTALEALEQFVRRQRRAGVAVHLAEVKGPVMDRLEKAGLEHWLAPGKVFLSASQAADALERGPAAMAA